jgi:iron(III) transport system permease protein
MLLKILPMVLLLIVTAAPLIILLAHTSAGDLQTDWSSFEQTLEFAAGGAAISTVVGCAMGILFGTRQFPGRRWLFVVSIVLIAAPPAFWWIGVTRLTSGFGNGARIVAAATAGGLALSPVSFLLVFASLRQIPSNLYQAARLTLPPVSRIRVVLMPLVKSALIGGFALTFILLLGESELPFLFGFRTLMTDVVTTFSQEFDVGRALPLIIPLLLTIFIVGVLSAKPLTRTLLTSTRGSHGVARKPGSIVLSACAALPALYVIAALAGYGLPIFRALQRSHTSVDLTTITVSVIEPVAAAWIAVFLTLMCAYPARSSSAMPYLVWVALLLFCVPAGIYAIGWIQAGQVAGGLTAPPVIAHASRATALCILGFAVGYSRLPASLESAARLVRTSPVRRAAVFVLPLIAISLIASSSLAAALTYADRDVASLLLPPGASRLTLNLYLASANASSSTIGVLAFTALCGAALTIILAAAGPALLWRKRA